MRAWALFYLCTTSRLEGSTARSAARQPAACRRVLVARAHLIGSELKVTKLEEFFSILPYTPHLNYYLSFDVCASFRVGRSVGRFRLSEKTLFNGCTYQKMLVYKVVTFLKRIKMAVFFLIFLDQIRPKWIKLDQT